MNVENDYSEDYSDPQADCFREKEALGRRLPSRDRPEETLRAFVASLTGKGTANRALYCRYKSANTDVVTVIAAAFDTALTRPAPLVSAGRCAIATTL